MDQEPSESTQPESGTDGTFAGVEPLEPAEHKQYNELDSRGSPMPSLHEEDNEGSDSGSKFSAASRKSFKSQSLNSLFRNSRSSSSNATPVSTLKGGRPDSNSLSLKSSPTTSTAGLAYTNRQAHALATATGAFKLTAMRRDPSKPGGSDGGSPLGGASPMSEAATVWKKPEDKSKFKEEIEEIKPDTTTADAAKASHTISTSEKSNAKPQAADHIKQRNMSDLSEEELLKLGIHLTQRLSTSELQARQFNWDEDDDGDANWPNPLGLLDGIKEQHVVAPTESIVESAHSESAEHPPPTVHNRSPRHVTLVSESQIRANKEETARREQGYAPKPAPWTVAAESKGKNVISISEQLKELSEQKQHHNQPAPITTTHIYQNSRNGPPHYNSEHHWGDQEPMDNRYRYHDYERRYRPDNPPPRQELFNEQSGQFESFTNRRPGPTRPVVAGSRIGISGRHGEEIDDHEGNHTGPERRGSGTLPGDEYRMRHRMLPPTSPSEKRESSSTRSVSPGSDAQKNHLSTKEEQDEVMRQLRENAKRRKEEELKKEQERQEAAKRKADEIARRLGDKVSDDDDEKTEDQEENKRKSSKNLESEFGSKSEEPTNSELRKSILLRPQESTDDNLSLEEGQAISGIQSILAEDGERISAKTISGSRPAKTGLQLWTGTSSNASHNGLWNNGNGARTTDSGGLWSNISNSTGTKYSGSGRSGPLFTGGSRDRDIIPFLPNRSPDQKRKALNQWSPISPVSGRSGPTNGPEHKDSKTSSDWRSKPSDITPKSRHFNTGLDISSASSSSSTVGNGSPFSPGTQDANGGDSSIPRNLSKFFPALMDRKELGLSDRDSKSDSLHNHQLMALEDQLISRSPAGSQANVDESSSSMVLRVVLPPSNEQHKSHEDSSAYRMPSLNSIQALQSAIARKLGPKAFSSNLMDSKPLPIPQSPIIANSPPDEIAMIETNRDRKLLERQQQNNQPLNPTTLSSTEPLLNSKLEISTSGIDEILLESIESDDTLVKIPSSKTISASSTQGEPLDIRGSLHIDTFRHPYNFSDSMIRFDKLHYRHRREFYNGLMEVHMFNIMLPGRHRKSTVQWKPSTSYPRNQHNKVSWT